MGSEANTEKRLTPERGMRTSPVDGAVILTELGLEWSKTTRGAGANRRDERLTHLTDKLTLPIQCITEERGLTRWRQPSNWTGRRVRESLRKKKKRWDLTILTQPIRACLTWNNPVWGVSPPFLHDKSNQTECGLEEEGSSVWKFRREQRSRLWATEEALALKHISQGRFPSTHWGRE